MIETLGLHRHPFWEERVEKFYQWFNKSASKTSKDAWTWEEGKDTSKWSTTRGASRRNQSAPANPADRPNPAEKAVQWRDIGLWTSRHKHSASTIRTVKPIKNAQFQRMTTSRRSVSRLTCSGSRRLLILFEGLLRILDCIADTVT